MMYIFIILAVVAVWGVAAYNRFVVLRNRVKEAWADIETQLKRRYDLIPNLLETVKGYAKHEKTLLENITKARTEAMGAETIREKNKTENVLSQTLKSLFAVSENYPQLRASDNFVELQKELSDTENKIQAARRFYNTNVMALNTKIEVFPANIIANLFKFEKVDFFEIEETSEREPVKVKF